MALAFTAKKGVSVEGNKRGRDCTEKAYNLEGALCRPDLVIVAKIVIKIGG